MWVTDQNGADSREDSERGWMCEESVQRERQREKQAKNKRQGLLSSPYHISSDAFSQSVPFSSQKRENPPCIMHKGIMNDSSGASLKECTQSLGILSFFLSILDTSRRCDVRPGNFV